MRFRFVSMCVPWACMVLGCTRSPEPSQTSASDTSSSSTGTEDPRDTSGSGESSTFSGADDDGETTSSSTSTGAATTESSTSSSSTSSTSSTSDTSGTGLEGDSGTTGAPDDSRFPQNLPSDYCIYPTTYDNDDVRAAYALWKETVVTAEGAGGYLRVRKPDSGTVIDSTVSEGIGYGMLAAVYMDDPEVFDNLWQYAMLHFNDNNLMEWEIDPSGNVIGTGAALDGDEDMAWALIMADRQWGGSGALERPYLDYAVELVQAMWDHEIDHQRGDMPLPGDSWGGDDVTNISYFAPAYYRLFGQITDNEDGWGRVIDRSYEILELSLSAEYGNADNGLVPAWCDSSGEPTEAYPGAPLHFQNDSTRTPFRIGQDYCYYGEPRALDYLQKITSFYTTVGIDNIVDGYELDGTPRPDFSMNGLQPASFVGPAGVGAMHDEAHRTFVDEAYAAVASGELTAGTIYYQKSWSVLSLLMMTGNFAELPAG